MNDKKIAFDKVIQKCKLLNYTILVPFIYKNCRSELYLKCNKDNYIWKTNYIKFINRDYKCAKCSNNIKITQEEAEEKIKNICEEKNYTLLEQFVYINNNTKIHLRCNKDNCEWYSRYDRLLINIGCPKCGKSLKLKQEEVEININKKCKDKNYTLLESFIYKNNKTKIHLKCNIDNHIWITNYNSFINNNKYCAECGNKFKISENKIKKLLTDNNIKYIYQYKNKQILNRQSLDFFLPDYNIAIEYQGRQHFKPINYFGGEKAYNEIVIRDKNKYNICQENNIKIFYFTYDKRINIDNYIDNVYINENELINVIKKVVNKY